MSDARIQRSTNPDLYLEEQNYGGNDPLVVRETDQYRNEYITSFVDKWDSLINWEARSENEGSFFVDVLRSRGKHKVLDAATGTGFHSVQLLKAGFDVTSADGSPTMLAKAFNNAKDQGLILKTVQSDWRWLGHAVTERYDAIICLGNSFTHLHNDLDRRRVLAEFYAALAPDGMLIIDQRNYDMILDRGYSSKHRYYYCGDQVVATPIHIDEEIVRFKYSFADGEDYTLNLCPIRRDELRRLLREAGFERIRTYGDFETVYDRDSADFLIHVAEKSPHAPGHPVPWGKSSRSYALTEDYYDSDDADAFYATIWGGEDLHLGIYEDTDDIGTASFATVDRMIDRIPNLGPDSVVVDFGSGYGGSARRIVQRTEAHVTCINLSDTQNDRNRLRTMKAGMQDRIDVLHADFEDIPLSNDICDVVWSQDAFLHSNAHDRVLAESWRVLKPGGYLIFTDPMQRDHINLDRLAAIYARLSLKKMGSMEQYRALAAAIGFEDMGFEDLSHHLPVHYSRIRDALLERRGEVEEAASEEYVTNMLKGLDHWIEGGITGDLIWGIFMFRKPPSTS